MLGYDKRRVITENRAAGAFPDLQLTTEEGIPWVVGDLKKADNVLTDPAKRMRLWEEKRRYVDGMTRYVLFVTPKHIAVHYPTGESLPDFVSPLELTQLSFDQLRNKLAFMGAGASRHEHRWADFVAGKLRYSYIVLNDEEAEPGAIRRLESDLRGSITDMIQGAQRAIASLNEEYVAYKNVRDALDSRPDLTESSASSKRRAARRLEGQYTRSRLLFEEVIPSFQEQYGSQDLPSLR